MKVHRYWLISYFLTRISIDIKLCNYTERNCSAHIGGIIRIKIVIYTEVYIHEPNNSK